jgi:hypothetical protein
MAACYWGPCHCPDAEPCAEHAGYNCGRWNTIAVQNLSQIQDALTRDAELAITALAADQRRVNDIRRRLERRRDELEREKNDVERALGAASSIGERRVAADRLQRLYDRVPTLHKELLQAVTDLSSINASARLAGSQISLSLIVPYSSPSGYCACYDVKRDRLAAIATQRDRQRQALTPLLMQRGHVLNQFNNLFSLVPDPNNLLKVFTTIAIGAAILVFILAGALTAQIAFLLGVIAFYVILFMLLAELASVDRQIMAVRQRMVGLDLAYYRLQSISTCQQPPAAPPPPGTTPLPPGTTPPPAGENAWLPQVIQESPGVSGPPDDDD